MLYPARLRVEGNVRLHSIYVWSMNLRRGAFPYDSAVVKDSRRPSGRASPIRGLAAATLVRATTPSEHGGHVADPLSETRRDSSRSSYIRFLICFEISSYSILCAPILGYGGSQTFAKRRTGTELSSAAGEWGCTRSLSPSHWPCARVRETADENGSTHPL